MSKVVAFANKGIIDIRAINTFGMSVKDNPTAIGFFGTGLKYAIAICLREGLEVILYAGYDRYQFQKREVTVRGKKFEMVMMNDREMPFTTELGKTWQLWQAYRELYCNCTDEHGEIFEREAETILRVHSEFSPGSTYFVVKGDKFLDVHRKRDEIILNIDLTLRAMEGSCDIYKKDSKHLFYRGIRVEDFPKPALLTYNLKNTVDLTEDRTVRSSYTVRRDMLVAIAGLKDRKLLKQVLNADEHFLESTFDFGDLAYYSSFVSDEFYSVLKEEFESNSDRLNSSARELHMNRTDSAALKNYEPIELTPVETRQLERATSIIKKLWPDFSDYKILVVKHLGEETVAVADSTTKTMVIARRTFEFSTKYLVSTLIEEFFHLKTGFPDHSRQMQTYLFDQLCGLIENHVINEAI